MLLIKYSMLISKLVWQYLGKHHNHMKNKLEPWSLVYIL